MKQERNIIRMGWCCPKCWNVWSMDSDLGYPIYCPNPGCNAETPETVYPFQGEPTNQKGV